MLRDLMIDRMRYVISPSDTRYSTRFYKSTGLSPRHMAKLKDLIDLDKLEELNDAALLKAYDTFSRQYHKWM